MTGRATAERQVAAFVARYSPELAGAIRSCRARLQALFPRGFALVYDNYNARGGHPGARRGE